VWVLVWSHSIPDNGVSIDLVIPTVCQVSEELHLTCTNPHNKLRQFCAGTLNSAPATAAIHQCLECLRELRAEAKEREAEREEEREAAVVEEIEEEDYSLRNQIVEQKAVEEVEQQGGDTEED
jgi:hypothetical protein